MTGSLRRFGDVTLNVADEGDGAPIVLLHGWSYDLHLWDTLTPRLLEEGWRVIRVDLRGHGRSPAAGPYSFTQLSHDVEAVLAEMTAQRPVLLGLSLGGFLSMRHAIEHPTVIRGVVLADTWTTPIPSDAEMAATLPESARDPAALAQWWSDRRGGDAVVAADPTLRAARDRFAQLDADGLRHAIAACAEREPVTEVELASIMVPALVIAGEHDRLFTPSMHASMAEAIPDARLHVIPDAGHISVSDAPDEFIRAVLAFLAALPSPDQEEIP
ncbi:alpha/beta fold hydrolase [Pseudactinotalea terrae]|uniref:alpha/beta fold hydrolase n=1 Tax=Pseudactinotalea terrae TaxID=1743262 RepID=UPI0012E2E5CC|nr:alpha/beta hydrolase [Pseudactinotalea terrae]